MEWYSTYLLPTLILVRCWEIFYRVITPKTPSDLCSYILHGQRVALGWCLWTIYSNVFSCKAMLFFCYNWIILVILHTYWRFINISGLFLFSVQLEVLSHSLIYLWFLSYRNNSTIISPSLNFRVQDGLPFGIFFTGECNLQIWSTRFLWK